MSPYIVTTTKPIAPDEHGLPYCGACSHYHEGACRCPDCGRPTPCSTHGVDRSVSTPAEDVSRRAVATLDEARMWAQQIVSDGPESEDERYDDACAACVGIPDSGDTIGPLPDGTTIEVEQVSWPWLASRVNNGAWLPEAEIVAAFNEASR